MLEDKFRKYIKEHALVEPNDKILVTVSGGVDSMVLLSLFAKEGYDIAVAHCNFQLRGEESDEDEVLVEQYAARHAVPHFNMRFDTQGVMDETGESVQIAARRLRYEWFNKLSEEHGYTAIAIAHHADDSIETFFINLMRGTGLKGLTGIHKTNGRIVRPLLFASRREILDYASDNNIPFREDSSNRSTKYLRNKIRLGIVPILRDINPKFTELMGENITRLTEAQMFISRCVEMIRDEVLTEANGLATIDPEKIDHKLPINFVIYEIMSSEYGFRGAVVDELFESLQRGTTGKRFYSRDHVAYIDRGKIVISPIAETDSCETELTKEHSRIYCGNSVLSIRHTDIDNIDTLIQPENVALLDMDKLQFPLHVRRWQEGDWFIPFGMDSRKKVSDYLIDTKVSMAEKNRQFVLLSGDDIVWLIGRRTDDRYKVDKGTENILKITKEIMS